MGEFRVLFSGWGLCGGAIRGIDVPLQIEACGWQRVCRWGYYYMNTYIWITQ